MSFASCVDSTLKYTLTEAYLDAFTPLSLEYLPKPYTIRTAPPLVFKNRPKDANSNFYRRKLRITSTQYSRLYSYSSVFSNPNVQVFMQIRRSDNTSIIKQLNITTQNTISREASRDPGIVMINVPKGFGFEVEIPDSEKCSVPIYVHMKIQYPRKNQFSTVVQQNRPFTFNCSLELLENGTFTSQDACNDTIVCD